jgi:class 3 adenylate cyclase/tetratricopeptide (TPR) repeat protein
MIACANCGRDNPEDARFCLECGNSLEGPASPEVRKLVTLVFTDVAGSTSMGEGRDPEAIRSVMSRYFAEMARIARLHGGMVEKFVGDAVMAAFGIPVMHEDDALRAVRAAHEMREALEQLNDGFESEWGIRIAVRTGVNTGEVVAGDPRARETFATGDTVNTAARLEQAAGAGEILLGEATYRLVRDAVIAEPIEAVAAKGKRAPVPAHRLLSIPTAEVTRARRSSRMIDRESELGLLRMAFERAVTTQTSVLAVVVGVPGVGKSRLVAELIDGLTPSTKILRGRCLSYGEGITLWPLAEAIRQAAGISETDGRETASEKATILVRNLPDVDRLAGSLASLLGLGSSASPIEEISWAVSSTLEAIAAAVPVLLLVEDVHWAEATLLRLLEDVAHTVRAPVLVCCTTRPELQETQPGWLDRDPSLVVRLEALAANDTMALLDELVAGPEVADVRERIATLAAGNPLFAEELVGMLIDDGVLRPRDGGWSITAEVSQLVAPPSIQALIATRLDRLPSDERTVAERASVIGKDFERRAILALATDHSSIDIEAALEALVRKDLVVSMGTGDGYAFRHVLIREGAYSRMSKRLRAELHAAFADWLLESSGERLTEVEEIIGYHLEQSSRHWVELRPPTEADRRLAERARSHLFGAGHRALARGDVQAAVNLLSRGEEVNPTPGAELMPLRLDLARALQEAGQLDEAEGVLARTAESASGDEAMQLRVAAARLMLGSLTIPEGWSEEAERTVERMLMLFDELGDDAGLAEAWDLRVELLWGSGTFGQVDDAIARAVEHARRAGDDRTVGRHLEMAAASMLWGPMPATEGLRRCGAALAEAPSRRVEAATLWALAGLTAMRGGFKEARELAARAREIRQSLGQKLFLASSQVEWVIEMLAGNASAAEEWERRGIEQLESMGERGYLSTKYGRAAIACARQGKDREALRLSELSLQTAEKDDRLSQMLWRSARALVLARRGESSEARMLAREAVRIGREGDLLNDQGDCLVALAKVLAAEGRDGEAAQAAREAWRLYSRKENVVSADAVRSVYAEASSSGP